MFSTKYCLLITSDFGYFGKINSIYMNKRVKIFVNADVTSPLVKYCLYRSQQWWRKVQEHLRFHARNKKLMQYFLGASRIGRCDWFFSKHPHLNTPFPSSWRLGLWGRHLSINYNQYLPLIIHNYINTGGWITCICKP